jgi:uncharacterized protein
MMTNKSRRISEMIEPFRGQDLDAHYLAYCDCFNRQLFFEAHDVLEELWLSQRNGANAAFHKGLIQLAGAFVHLQKGRLRPAAALFKLAEANLERYAASHEHLDVKGALRLIRESLSKLEGTQFTWNPLSDDSAPRVRLESGS